MNKYTTIFEAPVLSRSGYGEWSDSIFECLSTHPKLKVDINAIGWGSCPNRTATELRDRQIDAAIIRLQPGQKEIAQPDVYISCTIPNLDHAPIGKIANINFSAGIETDFVYDNVVDGLNKHTVNVVCSEFARKSYLNSPKKVTSPVEVVAWGADTSIYKMTKETIPSLEVQMQNVQEDECFLFVGQITNGNIFQDRKDVGMLCKTFLETFHSMDKKPALILKSSGVSFSTIDRNQCLERIQHIKLMVASQLNIRIELLPNIYLIHGELSETEMNALYNHSKVIGHVSFSHGEGFGMPLLQASLSGKPVIAPNYSGHLDFLPANRAILLEGSLQELSDQLVSEYFPPKSKWFVVDYNKASIVLKNFYNNDRTLHNNLAVLLAKENAEKFNLEKMKWRIHKILDKYIK